MTPDSIAKEKTKQLLTNLQSRQNTVINEIVLRVGTIKQKIIELADIMAERMDLLDPELPEGIGKEQISSLITQALKAQGCAIAPWINDYLPSKYKNQNKVRIHQTIEKINEICTDLPCKLPEQCSSSELETFYEINEQVKNLLDDGTSHCNKTEEKLEFTAQQRGQQLGGYKFRSEISHKDFSEDIPTELIPFVIKNRDHFYNIADSWRTLGDKYYADPPRVSRRINTG